MASGYATPSFVVSLGSRPWRFLRFLESKTKSSGTPAHPPKYFLELLARYVLGLTIISLITLFDVRATGANAITAGFTFLIAILTASTLW